MNDTMKRVLKTLAVLGVVIIAIIICMFIRSCRAEVEDPDATHTSSKEPTVEISNEPSNPPTESSVPTQEPIETRPPVEPTIEPTVEPTVNPTQKPVQNKPQVTVTVPPVNTEPQPTGSPNPTTEPGKSAVIVINDKASFYGDPLQKLDFTIVSGNATYDEIANAITLEKEPGTDAGEYKINGTYKSGNTTITVIGGATYTILPRPITVKVYNRSSYKGQSLETLKYELTKGTIAIGDSLKEVITLSTEADKNNVGKYPIKLHANKNYKVTWTDELGQVIKEAVYEVKAYRPVDPTDPPVRPTVRPTRPPVNPTDPPVNPTVKPTDPPVDPTVKPTDPPVDPTDPPVDPTVKPTDKIDTGTGDGGFGTGGGQGNVGGGNGQTGTGDGGFGTGGGQGTVGGGNGQTGTGDGGFGTGGGQGTVGGGNTQGGNGDGGFGTGGGQGTVGG